MKNVTIHKGDFKVTSEQVSNGMLIKEMIPREVTGSFYCNNNLLISLEGSPKTVCGDFYCYNNELTILEYRPEFIGGHFDCSNNLLTTLEGGLLNL